MRPFVASLECGRTKFTRNNNYTEKLMRVLFSLFRYLCVSLSFVEPFDSFHFTFRIICCDLPHCCFGCNAIFIFNDIFSPFFSHFLFNMCLHWFFFSLVSSLFYPVYICLTHYIERIQLHCDCIEIYFTEVIYFKSLLENTQKMWHRYRERRKIKGRKWE